MDQQKDLLGDSIVDDLEWASETDQVGGSGHVECWNDTGHTWVTEVGKKGHTHEICEGAIGKAWFLTGEVETGKNWKQAGRQSRKCLQFEVAGNDHSL